jgi:hypothetical protein
MNDPLIFEKAAKENRRAGKAQGKRRNNSESKT